MKLLIKLLFLSGLIASNAISVDEYLKELTAIHDDCMKSSQCKKDILVQHLTKGDVDDPKLREYLLCASKKRGYRNEAGVYQPEAHKKALMKLVKDEKVVDEMMKCVNEIDTPLESVLLSSRCFAKEVYQIIAVIVHEKIDESMKECMKETSVTEEAVKTIMEGKEPTDIKIKDYSLCIMKKLHGIEDNGALNVKTIKAFLYLVTKNKDTVHEIVEKCCKTLDSPKETAYQYVLCRFKLSKLK